MSALLPASSHADFAGYPHLSINDCPGSPFVIASAGEARTLKLCLGPTNPTSTGSPCVDGNGSELCAITAGIYTASGLSIEGFTSEFPGDGSFPNLIASQTSDSLRFNLLAPDGILASEIVLGSVDLGPSTSGVLWVAAESSRWVDASLAEGELAQTGLPEPSLSLLVGIGLVWLAILVRRAHRIRRLATWIAAGAASLASLMHGSSAAAHEYFSRDEFVGAIGSVVRSIDFELLPLNASGFAALQNGDRERQAVFSSLSLGAGVPLAGSGGLIGTFLAFDTGGSSGIVLSPGSANSGDDDVEIAFDVPVLSAGLTILADTGGTGWIRFLDPEDRELASYPLPGGSGSPDPGAAFVGYRIRPGERPIRKIIVDETDAPDPADDLLIDDVIYEVRAEPMADALVSYAPVIAAGTPVQAVRNALRALDAPDGAAVSLGSGGSLVVQFTDNGLSGDDSAAPDLRIYELDLPVSESSLVEISADGTTWSSLGIIPGGTRDIDLDAFGFGSTNLFFFVRITDNPAQGGAGQPAAGADIDAVVALSGIEPPPDADFDGVTDSLDVCAMLYNPGQTDADGDGIGDVCDNCPADANPSQSDQDLDGQGDECELATVRLEQLAPGPNGESRADVFLDCGGAAIERVNFGIVIPEGAPLVPHAFGGACSAPLPGVAPPIIPTGTGCVASPGLLGTSIDPAVSGIVGPGMPLPPGMRPDTVYVLLGGSGPDGRICDALETDVFLGRFVSSPVVAPPAAGFMKRALLTGAGLGAGLLSFGETTEGTAVYTSYASTVAGVAASEILLYLRPAAGEDPETVDRWLVCFDFDADHPVLDMNRISFGISGPPGVGFDELYMEGCRADSVSTASGNLCSGYDASPVDTAGAVDEMKSFTYGPFDSSYAAALAPPGPGDEPLASDTLYVALEGAYEAPDVFADYPRLNRVTPTCVATIAVPESMAGEDPTFHLVGLPRLPFTDGLPVPLRTVYGDPVADDSVGTGVAFDTGVDRDGDAKLDDDNCPYAYNPDQLNRGSFEEIFSSSPPFAPDPYGDACECADGNLTGSIFGTGAEDSDAAQSDVDRIRRYLIGEVGDTAIRDLCSTDGNPRCETVDLVRLQKAFSISDLLTPGLCYASVPDAAD